MSFGLS